MSLHRIAFLFFLLLTPIFFSQSLNWTGFPAGGTSYTSGITTVTVTSSAPGFQNGTPKYYAAATVGNGQCGIAGGLALEHNFGNITTAFSQLNFDFTSGGTTNGLCGNISFQIRDLNAEESTQTFSDWVEVWATDGNNVAVPVANITATGGTNKTITSSGNTRVVVGHNNSPYGSRSSTACDLVTFSISPAAGTTLRNVYLKYHPEYTASPNDYYNFTNPKRPAYQYISISPVTINATAGPTALQLTATPTACTQNNGTVTIGTVSGGTAPYQYNFNTQGLSSTTYFSGLGAGFYPVTVVDNAGCSYTSQATISQQLGPNAVQSTVNNATCGQANGSVSFGTVTGGTAPYQYNFNSLGFQSTNSFNNFASGNYPLVIQDANGCTYSTSVSIGNTVGPTSISSSNTPSYCGQNNGSLSINSTVGGTAPFLYNFNNLGFGSTTFYSNLSPGTYPIAVQDANNCLYSSTITISDESGPTAIAITSQPANCSAQNGQLILGNVTGGTAPYQFNFNNLGYGTATTFTNLGANTYSLLVKDVNGCVFSTQAVVSTNGQGPTSLSTVVDDAHCGGNDGSITITTVFGGTVPYQYSINGSALQSSSQFSNLIGGNYTISVQDNAGCVYDTVLLVPEVAGPSAIAFSTTPDFCNQTNGSAILGNVTGGSTPFTYSFNGAGFSTTSSYTNLSTGTYSLIVKDNFGCLFTTSINIVAIAGPTSISVQVVDGTCGTSNGQLFINSVLGGTAPYTYSLDGAPYDLGNSFSNLGAGTFLLSVKDANGCLYAETFTIGGTPAGPSNVVVSVLNPICGALEGSASFQVQGGVAPYSFALNGSNPFPTNSVSELPIGNYQLLVSDANACVYNTNFSIVTDNTGETILIPNVFSPNDDLTNPVWFVSGTCVQEMTGVIINRWGNTMKTLDSITDVWDGLTNDKTVSEGVYFYRIEVTFLSGRKETYHGNITLVR